MKSWATTNGQIVDDMEATPAQIIREPKPNHITMRSPKRSAIAPPGSRNATMKIAGAATMMPWSDNLKPKSIA